MSDPSESVNPVRLESDRKVRSMSGKSPTGSGQRNPGRAGKGWEKSPNNASVGRPMREKFAPGLALAARLLPDEHPPFVAVAISMLRMNHEPVTAESVYARLKATGRTTAQLNPKEPA